MTFRPATMIRADAARNPVQPWQRFSRNVGESAPRHDEYFRRDVVRACLIHPSQGVPAHGTVVGIEQRLKPFAIDLNIPHSEAVSGTGPNLTP
jgi:hypothetical protein